MVGLDARQRVDPLVSRDAQLVRALRRSWFATAAPLGASLACYLGATNDVWGANQEPNRFWLDMMLLISVGLLPLVVDAFVVVLDGTMGITIGGKPVTAGAGTIVRLPANVPHALEAEDKVRLLLVMLRDESRA